MSDQWKVWEREGARDLGGTRTGPRGDSLPDSVDIPDLAPEFKYRQKLSLRREDIKQARRNGSRIGKKFWVVGIREAKSGERFAIMEWKMFTELYNLYLEVNHTSV